TVQGVASMTPVQVSQATASNLNATVVGTGTFAVQANPGTAANWGVGATGSAVPANAQLSGFSDGTNTVAGRVTSAALADNFTPPTSGLQQVQSFGMGWDGTNWDRLSATGGALNVICTSGCSGSGGTSSSFGSTFPTTGTAA